MPSLQIISLLDVFISPLEDLCVALAHVVITPINNRMHARYFVTELLGTDLHRLLTSRPLEKQFIQYFLYQILVRGHGVVRWLSANAPFSAVSNAYTRRASFIAISCVMKPFASTTALHPMQKPSNILINENCDLKVGIRPCAHTPCSRPADL